jgi:hypothetical protein
MGKIIIGRRSVLRGAFGAGALVTLPLPRLGAMLNSCGTAYAQGSPLRKVFGVWFYGNGMIPGRFIPKGEGSGFPLSEQLQPLAKVKSKLTVITGMELKTGRADAHSYGATGWLGGARHADNPGTKEVRLPTIDQVIADHLGKDCPRRSIEIGVTRARHRTRGVMYDAVSHRGRNAPNYPEFNPAAVWKALFGGAALPTGAPPDDRHASARRSVLDAVKADAADLTRRLGAEDRRRLEAHLEAVRGLERRLMPPMGGGASCKDLRDPTGGVLPDTKDEAPPEVNRVMADALVLALSCDVTRVFSFMFSYPAAHVYFRHIGLAEDFHNTLCHAEAEPQPKVNKGVLYTMECFAYLLEQMDKVNEGDRTLLDNACVLTGTCVAYGRTHQREEWPIMIGGKAGGALKGDFHYRALGDNPSKVLLTLANIHGVGLQQIGLDGCQTNQEISVIRSGQG